MDVPAERLIAEARRGPEKGDLNFIENVLTLSHKRVNDYDEEDEFRMIHVAARTNFLELMKCLERFKPELTPFTKDDGYTPLHYAVDRNHVEIAARILVENPEAIRISTRDSAMSPLHVAIHSRRIECIEMLVIAFHANVNTRDKYGQTPLHYCAKWGHIEIGRLLYAHGAKIIPDMRKETPIDVAIRYGNSNFTTAFRQSGASSMMMKKKKKNAVKNTSCDVEETWKDILKRVRVELHKADPDEAVEDAPEKTVYLLYKWGGDEFTSPKLAKKSENDMKLLDSGGADNSRTEEIPPFSSYLKSFRTGCVPFNELISPISKPFSIDEGRTRRVLQIALGHNFCVVRTDTCQVFTWGTGREGQLGLGDVIRQQKPRAVPNLGGIVYQIAAGNRHAGAILDGEVEEEIPDKIDTLSGMPMTRKVVKPVIYTWGLNSSGQLGLGDENNRNLPEMVQKIWDTTEIRMGGAFTIAFVKSIKRTFSWGSSRYGQLGNGDLYDRNSPREIRTLRGQEIRALCCGSRHSIALTNIGLFAWGDGRVGQLGNGTKRVRVVPFRVVSNDDSKTYQEKGGGFDYNQVQCVYASGDSTGALVAVTTTTTKTSSSS